MPQTQPPSAGGWTTGQLFLYRLVVAAGALIWSFISPFSWRELAVLVPLALAMIPPLWIARVAATAIALYSIIVVPGLASPPPALFAALLFVVTASTSAPVGTWPLLLSQTFAVIGVVSVASFSQDWPWLVLLLPVFLTPARIPGLSTAKPEMLFYDGHCGLCHNVIRFVLAEDLDGSRFRFAPLDSDAFRSTIPESIRRTLPDSVVIWTENGEALSKSRAVLHMLHRLGGYWRVLAILATPLPKNLCDALYDFVAKIRYRLFRPPADACPLMPKELRSRFELF